MKKCLQCSHNALESLKTCDLVVPWWRDRKCYKKSDMEFLDSFKGYAGLNFWWATSEHIRRLFSLDSVNQTNRFFAEQWIGSGSFNVMSLETNQTYEY